MQGMKIRLLTNKCSIFFLNTTPSFFQSSFNSAIHYNLFINHSCMGRYPWAYCNNDGSLYIIWHACRPVRPPATQHHVKTKKVVRSLKMSPGPSGAIHERFWTNDGFVHDNSISRPMFTNKKQMLSLWHRTGWHGAGIYLQGYISSGLP